MAAGLWLLTSVPYLPARRWGSAQGECLNVQPSAKKTNEGVFWVACMYSGAGPRELALLYLAGRRSAVLLGLLVRSLWGCSS